MDAGTTTRGKHSRVVVRTTCKIRFFASRGSGSKYLPSLPHFNSLNLHKSA